MATSDAVSLLPDSLREVLPRSRFYARKFANIDLHSTPLGQLPFTHKSELIADQQEYPLYGSVITESLERYCRLHQTSGTTSGRPLRWLDTPESWQSLLECWRKIWAIVGLNHQDRLFFPFSFGPFLGFWTAFESATQNGYLCLPAGGMSTTARLRFLLEHQATIVCCTPTYALHLAEVAQKEGVDLASSAIRSLIVAGEPGGAIPATRARIESLWGAKLFDHYGLTEIGPVAVEVPTAGTQESAEATHSMQILHDHYLVEVIDPKGTSEVPTGEIGELVLTNLKRLGSPLVRYRTGDLVRMVAQPSATNPDKNVWMLPGGILGRTDDMIHIRGNNIYPGAIEAVVLRFSEVAEFRIVLDDSGPLTDLGIEVEPTNNESKSGLAEAVARALRDALLFRVEVRLVEPGSLPRYEMKSRRIVRRGA